MNTLYQQGSGVLPPPLPSPSPSEQEEGKDIVGTVIAFSAATLACGLGLFAIKRCWERHEPAYQPYEEQRMGP